MGVKLQGHEVHEVCGNASASLRTKSGSESALASICTLDKCASIALGQLAALMQVMGLIATGLWVADLRAYLLHRH